MTKYQVDLFDLPSGVLLQKHERGELLYRNIFRIRCWFQASEETELDSLISFYTKKEGLMTVEVFIHTLEHKMSIASQVSIPEIFGVDHEKLSFSQKTQVLDHMMEKLFVIQSEGQYHLKVDNDAVPLSHLR